ncbi:response regulator [Aerococcaceae bacterium NML130460]|nr:response regulator [Aerococcaceae bacterium NML130460]
MNILVVDDETIIRQNFVKRLTRLPLAIEHIFEAKNGYEALGIAQQHTIELALVDINMPFFDGLTLIERLHEMQPQLKVIIISGYNEFNYAKRAIELGVVAYLLKPIDRQEFNQTIEKVYHSIKETQPAITFKQQILTIMKENLANVDFNLSMLATEMNLSANYLSKLIRNNFKVSFVDLLKQIRIEHAKKLLHTHPSTIKIYEVATLTGFSNQYYFSQVFKQETGLPPKEYAKQAYFAEK